jgi:hypothetical protein
VSFWKVFGAVLASRAVEVAVTVVFVAMTRRSSRQEKARIEAAFLRRLAQLAEGLRDRRRTT